MLVLVLWGTVGCFDKGAVRLRIYALRVPQLFSRPQDTTINSISSTLILFFAMTYARVLGHHKVVRSTTKPAKQNVGQDFVPPRRHFLLFIGVIIVAPPILFRRHHTLRALSVALVFFIAWVVSE